MRTVILPALILAFDLPWMPVLKGGMFGLTTTRMAWLIATATTTRSQGITSIGLMRCASARSGGGIYTTSSTADVVADKLSTVMGPRYAAPRHQSFGRDLPHL
jgi:hypothetical protein